MVKKEKRSRKRKKIILIVSLLLVTFLIIILFLIYGNKFGYKDKKNFNNNKEIIQSHYNKYVKTNKEASLYMLVDDNYSIVGQIGENIEVTLSDQVVNNETKYFKVEDFEDDFYVNYQDVDKIDELSSNIDGDRYKNYIVFNENIITNETTSFYDENDKLIYKLNKSYEFPIIIKEDNKYGINFNNKLLYVKKEDVKEIKKNNNTDKKNSSGVGVLNYHAFYDENNPEEKADCTTEICHSKSQFKSHLDYFNNNDIWPITMKEMERYIDGKLQLPKSVLVTIDDGPKTEVAVDLLTEYKMHATIFLITSWFDLDKYYKTDYIEFHSHSHNMHEVGDCPTGQGGGIQCLSEDIIQNDLRQSREALNGTTVFCYPFYEYNEYSIRMLKEAGFTMAFIGESNNSDNLVHVGADKFRLRRFVIVTYTTINDLNKYFGQIK